LPPGVEAGLAHPAGGTESGDRLAGGPPAGDEVEPERLGLPGTTVERGHRWDFLVDEKAPILPEPAIRPCTGRLLFKENKSRVKGSRWCDPVPQDITRHGT